MTHATRNRPGVASEAVHISHSQEENNPSLTDPTQAIQYPSRIRPSAKGESYIEQLAHDMILGHVELWQLSPALLAFWTFAHEAGSQSRQPEIDHLNRENERLYHEMTQRTPKPRGQYISWADLQELRAQRQQEAAGNYEGGDLFAAWGVTHV